MVGLTTVAVAPVATKGPLETDVPAIRPAGHGPGAPKAAPVAVPEAQDTEVGRVAEVPVRRAMGRPLPVGRIPPGRRATVASGAREARVRVGRAARVALVIDERVGHAAPA